MRSDTMSRCSGGGCGLQTILLYSQPSTVLGGQGFHGLTGSAPHQAQPFVPLQRNLEREGSTLSHRPESTFGRKRLVLLQGAGTTDHQRLIPLWHRSTWRILYCSHSVWKRLTGGQTDQGHNGTSKQTRPYPFNLWPLPSPQQGRGGSGALNLLWLFKIIHSSSSVFIQVNTFLSSSDFLTFSSQQHVRENDLDFVCYRNHFGRLKKKKRFKAISHFLLLVTLFDDIIYTPVAHCGLRWP